MGLSKIDQPGQFCYNKIDRSGQERRYSDYRGIYKLEPDRLQRILKAVLKNLQPKVMTRHLLIGLWKRPE